MKFILHSNFCIDNVSWENWVLATVCMIHDTLKYYLTLSRENLPSVEIIVYLSLIRIAFHVSYSTSWTQTQLGIIQTEVKTSWDSHIFKIFGCFEEPVKCYCQIVFHWCLTNLKAAISQLFPICISYNSYSGVNNPQKVIEWPFGIFFLSDFSLFW